MHCPSCHAGYTEGDLYCQNCGADLAEKSTSIVPLQTNLPAILYNSPIPRNVAASVGALAVGVGLELLRRNLLSRLQKGSVDSALPALGDMKDLFFSQNNNKKRAKLPRGYEVQETVYYVRRVTRRA